MSAENFIACSRGEKMTISWSMDTSTNITGWTLVFEVRTGSFEGTVVSALTKTSGDSDFTVTSTATGTATIVLSSSNTNRTATKYFCTISRTNSGNETLLSEIVWEVKPSRVSGLS